METEKKHRGGRQFPPGVSGNPKGRPLKGYSITEAFRAMLVADPEAKRKIVDSIKDKALKGDPAAQKLIWNYMDGLPPKSPDDAGESDGNPIRIVIARL